MKNKWTLDDWLNWQETLMEETIVLGLDRVGIVYDLTVSKWSSLCSHYRCGNQWERALPFLLLIVFIVNRNTRLAARPRPTY